MLQSSRPTVYIETYGCQMNVSDSELMLGKLAAHRAMTQSTSPTAPTSSSSTPARFAITPSSA